MSVSLEKAVEICCRACSCTEVSEIDFRSYLKNYGINLTAEVYMNKTKGDIEESYIFYRDIRDDDVLGLEITNSEKAIYRIIHLTEFE